MYEVLRPRGEIAAVHEQRTVAHRAEELVALHNLRELRALAGRTQEDVSAGTGFKQTNVSKLEKRANMKLSTLRDYVESLGGTLKIVADVEGKKADLSSIAAIPTRFKNLESHGRGGVSPARGESCKPMETAGS